MAQPTLVPDPDIHTQSTDDLGWVGSDHADYEKQREHFLAYNGIRGLDACEPHETESAARCFHRDCFVLVTGVLDDDTLEFLKAGVDREVRNVLAMDRDRAGNRGSHRYSFGSASLTGHLVHLPEWYQLIDLPTVTPILDEIFASRDYILRGGGGDFCLPGAVHYQPLHSDMGNRVEYPLPNGRTGVFGSFRDERGFMTYRDLPPPYVCCNFLITDITPLNGPTRQIPGTQNSREPIPTLEDEPEWMKLSTVCPAPAGSVLIRDVRAWHGGTPNLSEEVRAMPNLEYFAPWYRERNKVCLPFRVWETLSDHGRDICRHIVADSSVDLATGYRTNLGGTPGAFLN